MTLKELRNKKGLSQVEAAKFLSVPIRSYKRYETEHKYEGTIKYEFLLKELNKYRKEVQKTHVKRLNVIVAGIGYVGLPAALLLSKKANVKLVDINKDKVNLINNHVSPIPNEDIVAALKASNLTASDSIYTYRNADVVIVATPTNLDTATNRLDTFSVESVVMTIRQINRKCLIVIKSTVGIGLTERLAKEYGGTIMFVPEFLREKYALKDASYPSRIIFGVNKVNKKVEKYAKLVESCIKNDEKVIYMKPSDAEAVKLFSNTYLAMRIAFFNELDSFATQNGLDTSDIIRGMGKDSRIGDIYNNPSIMFEGYCLPKDTAETSSTIKDVENNQLITSIIISNNSRLSYIEKKTIDFAKILTGKSDAEIVIGIYDLETQQNVKSFRSTSSIRLLNKLKEDHFKVIVFDKNYPNSEKDFGTFVSKSDVIVTNAYHKELKKYKKKVISPSII